MARIIDITDKLGLGGRPEIVINGESFPVNDSAAAVLGIMSEVGDGDFSPKVVSGIYERLFDAKTRKRIDAMKLSFADFSTLVFAALDLAVDAEEDDGGNAATPATT